MQRIIIIIIIIKTEVLEYRVIASFLASKPFKS